MNIFDKAKEISNMVTEKATEFSSDDLIAETIIKAVEKQENVNAVLKKRGAKYRVSDLDIQMGIPPTVTFGVRRIGDGDEQDS